MKITFKSGTDHVNNIANCLVLRYSNFCVSSSKFKLNFKIILEIIFLEQKQYLQCLSKSLHQMWY